MICSKLKLPLALDFNFVLKDDLCRVDITVGPTEVEIVWIDISNKRECQA